MDSLLPHNRVVYLIQVKQVEDKKLEEQLSKDLLEFIKSLITQKEAFQYLAFYREEAMFMFLGEITTQKIIEYLNKLGILISYKEITLDILLERLDSMEFKHTLANDSRFVKMIRSFRQENLSVDLVLDKINDQGLESLNETDYIILQTLINE